MSAQSPKQLPPEVIAALQRGNLVEAIKLLRAVGNFDLKQAKQAIEQHLDRSKVARVTVNEAVGSLLRIPAVMEAMRRGNKIDAIRILREKTGVDLKEAKDAVDRFHEQSMDEQPPTTSPAAAPRPTLSSPGLAPGEVPQGPGAHWVLIALIVIGALIVYFALRG